MSYWAAENKIFIYARPWVNKDFVHDDVFSCVFPLFYLVPKNRRQWEKNFLEFFLELSFVLATQTQTNSKSGGDVSKIIETE